MKVTIKSYKNPDGGLHKITQGTVVTCDTHPSVPYMVVFSSSLERDKELINLETGNFANDDWVAGQQWHVREAELIVK